MLMLSTGNPLPFLEPAAPPMPNPMTSTAQLQHCLPAGSYELSIDWRFYSAELVAWCATDYQDTFEMRLEQGDNSTVLLAFSVADLCPGGAQYKGLSPAGILFDQGGVYRTPWVQTTHTLLLGDDTSPDAPFELKLVISDTIDTDYDSAILIDRIVFTSSEAP